MRIVGAAVSTFYPRWSKTGACIIWAGAAVAGLFANSPAVTQALVEKIRAPIGCDAAQADCRDDITLADALKSSEQTTREYTQCLSDQKERDQEFAIQQEEDNKATKPGELPKFRFHNRIHCNVHLDMSRNCDDEFPGAKGVHWAPVEIIKDGQLQLEKFLARAASTNAVDNQIVVEATESKLDEQHLALCDVRTINGKYGPPRNCKTIAIVTPTSKLLRSEFSRSEDLAAAQSRMCLSSATVRLSTGIDIEFEVHTKLDPKRFSDALYRGLTEQLLFQSAVAINTDDWGKITSIDIRSTAPLRDSLILGAGWREAIDFDVHLRVQPDTIQVWSYTRPMVCRQAAGQTVEYHGPDNAQTATYARVLDNFVGKALALACTKAKQIDSKQIECE